MCGSLGGESWNMYILTSSSWDPRSSSWEALWVQKASGQLWVQPGSSALPEVQHGDGKNIREIKFPVLRP
jgi:hypothetical protein